MDISLSESKTNSEISLSPTSGDDGGERGPKLPTTDSMEKELGLKRRVTAQNWTGPDDPENPMNWPLWERIYNTVPSAAFAWIVTLGSSAYTPGIPDIMESLNVSTTVALLGLSLYVLGLAFGPMLAAPISETMGRRMVYFTSIPLASLFILGAGFSQTFASFAVCRFFAGFFASPVLAVGVGTLSDLWPPVHRAVSTGAFLLAPFLGTAIGPVAGGFAAQYKGWRWTQWPVLFILVPFYLCSLGTKETYKKIILQNRAKKLGILPPMNSGPKGLNAVKFLLSVTLLRPVKMLFVEPIVGFFSLYTGFNFSVLFAFFEAFPLVFEGTYHFEPGFYGLTYFGKSFGCLFAVATIVIIDRLTFRKEQVRSLKEGRGGAVAPEHRLYPAMLGSFGLPIALFWFAWTAKKEVHWISPVLAEVPFGWGNLCVFASAALYLMDVYGPLNGASAMAANGLVRYGLGAAFPLFTIPMYERLGIAWATSLLGFLSLTMLPIPWILFKYGPQIRAKSSFDTTKA